MDIVEVAAVAAVMTVAAMVATVLDTVLVCKILPTMPVSFGARVALSFDTPLDALIIAGMMVQPLGTGGPSISSSMYDMRDPAVKPMLYESVIMLPVSSLRSSGTLLGA